MKPTPTSSMPSFTASEREAFDEICRVAVNKNYLNNRSGRVATAQAYRDVLDCGFEPADVLAAWRERQAQAERTVSSRRMFPQVKRWLIDDAPTSARTMLAQARRRRAEKDRRRRELAAKARAAAETPPSEAEVKAFLSETDEAFGALERRRLAAHMRARAPECVGVSDEDRARAEAEERELSVQARELFEKRRAEARERLVEQRRRRAEALAA